ncbi:hypothetical protein TcCL_ESM00343, partial [Trypanosoma cruzi]
KFWVASAPRREGGCSDHDGERHACAAHECTAAPPSRRPLPSIVGAGELRQAIREGPLHGGHGVRSEGRGRGGRGAMRCGKGAGCCGRTSLSSLQFVVMKGLSFLLFLHRGFGLCVLFGCWEERVRSCCAFRESCGRTVIRGGAADVVVCAGWLRGEGQGARCLSLLWELRCIDSPLGSWNPRATLRRVRWHDRAGEGSLRSCVFSPRWTWAAGRLADAAKRGIRCHLPGRQRNVAPLLDKCGIFICPSCCFLLSRETRRTPNAHTPSFLLAYLLRARQLFAGACPPRGMRTHSRFPEL